MKKLVALVLAVFSGLYLVVMLPTLDPLPFLDEGLATLIFLNALLALGIDPRRAFAPRERAVVPVRGRRD